jgi:hypothetical protein
MSSSEATILTVPRNGGDVWTGALRTAAGGALILKRQTGSRVACRWSAGDTYRWSREARVCRPPRPGSRACKRKVAVR